MNEEIINQVLETEAEIEQLQKEVDQEYENLLIQQEKTINEYIKELDEKLKLFEEQQDEKNKDTQVALKEKHSQEIVSYRNTITTKYEQQRSQLRQLGVKEVIESYGDFSYEENQFSS